MGEIDDFSLFMFMVRFSITTLLVLLCSPLMVQSQCLNTELFLLDAGGPALTVMRTLGESGTVNVSRERMESRQDLLRVLQRIERAEESSCLVLYFTGRAIHQELGPNAYVSYLNTSTNSAEGMPISARGVSFRLIRHSMLNSDAHSVLLIVDDVLKGTNTRSFADLQSRVSGDEGSPGRDRYVLSLGGQDDVHASSATVMARLFAAGFWERAADANGDEVVDILELYAYLTERLPMQTNALAAPVLRGYERDGGVASVSGAGNLDGRLRVITEPEMAMVRVDGVDFGSTPSDVLEVPSGEVLIELMAEDYLTWEESRYIESGEEYLLDVELNLAYGYLSIDPLPQGATLISADSVYRSVDSDDQVFRLPVGLHDATLVYAGGEVLPITLQLASGQTESFQFAPDQFDVSRPIQSLFLPGLGQRKDKAKLKGTLFLASTVLAGLALGGTHVAYQRAEDDYLELFEAYQVEPLETELLVRWGEVTDAFDDADRWNSLRSASLAALIGVYAVNLLDAWIFHSRQDKLIPQLDSNTPSFSLQGHPGSAGLTLTMTW